MSRISDICSSAVRPPAGILIEVLGTDSNGNDVELEWTGNNVMNASFKCHIDPTGKTLPYMELVWKEFYYGKLNSDNYPEIYENVMKHMLVTVNFTYEIEERYTWDDIGNYTWSSRSSRTWSEFLRQNISVLGKSWGLFLTAKPTIEGNIITWTARDLLYFLNSNVEKAFEGGGGIPFDNPLRWLLLNEQFNFVNSPSIYDMLGDQGSSFFSGSDDLDKMVVLKGTTKNLLKDYASIRSCYLTFGYGGVLKIEKFSDLVNQSTSKFTFSRNLMRSNPSLTTNIGLSAYSFKRYYHFLDSSNVSEREATISEIRYDSSGNGYMYAEYDFGSLGTSNLEYDEGTVIAKKGYYIGSQFLGAPDVIEVTPLVTSSTDEYILNRNQGEVYTEDNPINPYDKNSDYIWEKLDILEDWYDENVYSMEIDSLCNLSLDCGDLVEVETNLYDGDETITKKAIIVGIELKFNGTIKQKTYLHEVN